MQHNHKQQALQSRVNRLEEENAALKTACAQLQHFANSSVAPRSSPSGFTFAPHSPQQNPLEAAGSSAAPVRLTAEELAKAMRINQIATAAAISSSPVLNTPADLTPRSLLQSLDAVKDPEVRPTGGAGSSAPQDVADLRSNVYHAYTHVADHNLFGLSLVNNIRDVGNFGYQEQQQRQAANRTEFFDLSSEAGGQRAPSRAEQILQRYGRTGKGIDTSTSQLGAAGSSAAQVAGVVVSNAYPVSSHQAPVSGNVAPSGQIPAGAVLFPPLGTQAVTSSFEPLPQTSSPTPNQGTGAPTSETKEPEAGTVKHYVKVKPITLPPLPNPGRDLKQWKVEMAENVSNAYIVNPNKAFRWVDEIEAAPNMDSLWDESMPELEYEFNLAMKKVISSSAPLKRKIEKLVVDGKKNRRRLCSRQIVYVMYEFLKPRERGRSIYDINDLTNCKLHVDARNCSVEDLDKYITRWEEVLSGMKSQPCDDDLQA